MVNGLLRTLPDHPGPEAEQRSRARRGRDMRGVFAGRLSASGVLLVAALALAGCNLREARLDGADGLTTASTGTGSLKAVAEAGRRWEADPANAELGLAYAGRLEALGESDRQLQVLQVLSQKNPGDVRI